MFHYAGNRTGGTSTEIWTTNKSPGVYETSDARALLIFQENLTLNITDLQICLDTNYHLFQADGQYGENSIQLDNPTTTELGLEDVTDQECKRILKRIRTSFLESPFLPEYCEILQGLFFNRKHLLTNLAIEVGWELTDKHPFNQSKLKEISMRLGREAKFKSFGTGEAGVYFWEAEEGKILEWNSAE